MVLMYADVITESMRHAVEETTRRRAIQEAFNQAHHIIPASVEKRISGTFIPHDYPQHEDHATQIEEDMPDFTSNDDLDKLILSMEKEMRAASRTLNFEKAAALRDQIKKLKQLMLFDYTPSS
jgi:excinuclease ABC subunit B